MNNLPDFDDYCNPPVNEREERRKHTPSAASTPHQDQRSPDETTLTLAVVQDVLRDVFAGLSVPQDTIRAALNRVRRELGSYPWRVDLIDPRGGDGYTSPSPFHYPRTGSGTIPTLTPFVSKESRQCRKHHRTTLPPFRRITKN
jgi:hypothetical protein